MTDTVLIIVGIIVFFIPVLPLVYIVGARLLDLNAKIYNKLHSGK